MSTIHKRCVGFVFVVAIVLGLLPCVAHAAGPKLKTKIVFDASPVDGYGRHWSLETTSVAPIFVRARLLYRQPRTGRWVGFSGRKVTVSRDAGPRANALKRTTDSDGYFMVGLTIPAQYAVAYAGSGDSLPSRETRQRVDDVAMTKTTSVTAVPVDAVTARVTFVTDYRYNPRVEQLAGGVSLDTVLGMRDPLGGEITWIRPKSSDVFEWRYFGSGRSEVSFLVASDALDAGRLEFVSSVKYLGRQAFVSSGPADEPAWQPKPDTAGLWLPSAGSVPTSGSYVLLQSDPGDYVGQGRNYLYTRANAEINVSSYGGGFRVRVSGTEWWDGIFTLPNDGKGLRPGYYPDMRRFAYYDPSKGALDWSGDGRGNNTLNGWLIVDSVTYTRGVLTAIDLRFEQHGEGRGPALRGAIHWVSDNPPLPPGPLNPIPEELWRPAAASIPASGTFVYLDSDAGDYVGQGLRCLYAAPDSAISVTAESGGVYVTVNNASTWWRGVFCSPLAGGKLVPGYYPYLKRAPFHDPAQGGLDWSGQGRGNNALTGWFVVDSAEYVDGALKSVDLRFEQHSEGHAAAMRGVIHWEAED